MDQQANLINDHGPFNNLNPWMRILQLVVFSAILLTVFGMLVHNFFAPTEKDIPQDTIVNLVKFIPSVGAFEEWPNVTRT